MSVRREIFEIEMYVGSSYAQCSIDVGEFTVGKLEYDGRHQNKLYFCLKNLHLHF